MAPKNKGKKGKKNDDDYWEKAGETIEPSMTISMNVSDNEGGSSPKPKNSFSAFSASIDPQDAGALEDDGDGGGGLMVRGIMSIVIIRCAHFDQQSLLRANKTKKKDKKDIKKAKVSVLGLPVESVPEDTDDPVPSKHGIEAAAVDLSDEESRLMEEKKQGKKKGKAIVEEEEVAHPTGELQERIPAQEQAQDSGPKILSKKEKEKLKKEREKAKKKAQAAVKKTEAMTDASTILTESTLPVPVGPQKLKDEAEVEDDGEQLVGTTSKDKKKKKKKTKKDEESAPMQALPTGKKRSAIDALRARIEENKRLEEEARRREEEERKRIEEEERKAEEEARKKEEEKQRRKEKEKVTNVDY
ncbi:eukaryotic translation initiation factor 5B [Leucoagaricus gongylophorus]